MQRLRSAEMLEQVAGERNHPLIRETRRECMQELWDAEGVRDFLWDIRSGAVEVREIYSEIPSPMSLPLQWGQEAAVMYDYAPTPQGIHRSVETAWKQEKELLEQPDERELIHVQERDKLPKDEKQLHSLLMTEGDLAAGELDIPAEWLDRLARDGRVLYLEQGLWIAAEQREEYAAALGEDESGKRQEGKNGKQQRLPIVRRMLRYRGAADAEETAQRYGWPVSEAEEILEELCRRKEAVGQDGKFYHGELYRRARIRTLKKQREEVSTCSGEAYAALLLSRMESSAPAEECLRSFLKRYTGAVLPASLWEGVLLPRWIKNYREAMLDAYLAEGELFWHMEGKEGLRFDAQEEIDWDGDLGGRTEGLDEKERIIYEALLKRGASFLQSLNGLLPDESSYDTLLALLEKGLVYADSYIPVRQWMNREKTRKSSVRQRVNVKVKALRAGRWDVVRPLKEQPAEKKLENCFSRYVVLTKETAAACGLPWQEALEILRIWEYTGQTRRGYFVDGMSGAQFIRREDYAAAVRMLRNPEKKPVWVNAADPVQCWGKILPHKEGRNFLNIPGNAVACLGGLPVAVMEKQGKTLRVFDGQRLEECMKLFTEEYKRGKIFPAIKRVVVKEYPAAAAAALAAAGFLREMQDYVLYR